MSVTNSYGKKKKRLKDQTKGKCNTYIEQEVLTSDGAVGTWTTMNSAKIAAVMAR